MQERAHCCYFLPWWLVVYRFITGVWHISLRVSGLITERVVNPPPWLTEELPTLQTLQVHCARKHSTAAAGEAIEFIFFFSRGLQTGFNVCFLDCFQELEILTLIFSLNLPCQCFPILRDAPSLLFARFYFLEKVCEGSWNWPIVMSQRAHILFTLRPWKILRPWKVSRFVLISDTQ